VDLLNLVDQLGAKLVAESVWWLVDFNISVKLKLRRVELLMTLHLRATGCHFHMGSHSVTCHRTEVNTRYSPLLNPGQRPVLDLPNPEGWKAELK